MTERISDERLRTLIEKCHSSDWQAPKEHCSYGVGIGELEAMAAELLSLRSLNKRLVEDGERLYKAIIHARIMFINIEVESDKKYAQDVDSSITAHCALMKEIGG